MDKFFERLWDFISMFFGGLLKGFGAAFDQPFWLVQRPLHQETSVQGRRDQVLELKYQQYSDEQLKGETDLFRQRLQQVKPGRPVDRGLRRLSRGGTAVLMTRHYDVQLIGGWCCTVARSRKW